MWRRFPFREVKKNLHEPCTSSYLRTGREWTKHEPADDEERDGKMERVERAERVERDGRVELSCSKTSLSFVDSVQGAISS